MYEVISPDGFSIHRDIAYSSLKDAKKALREWMMRYNQQGYYSSNKGRISLEDLEYYCKIIKLN